jgi:hypothetical protein
MVAMGAKAVNAKRLCVGAALYAFGMAIYLFGTRLGLPAFLPRAQAVHVEEGVAYHGAGFQASAKLDLLYHIGRCHLTYVTSFCPCVTHASLCNM